VSRSKKTLKARKATEDRQAELDAVSNKFDDQSWRTSFNSAGNIAEHIGRPEYPQMVPIGSLAAYPDHRTITIVAETVSYQHEGKRKTRVMEAGRMAAQVGHAVSKLKLSYVIWSVQSKTEASR
jgi:hypothetical protein